MGLEMAFGVYRIKDVRKWCPSLNENHFQSNITTLKAEMRKSIIYAHLLTFKKL